MDRVAKVPPREHYLVLARYLTLTSFTPFTKDHHRALGVYEARTPDEAFQMFLAEYAPEVSDAQRFYDDIIIVPIGDGSVYPYKMSDQFGQLAEFPNPALMITR